MTHSNHAKFTNSANEFSTKYNNDFANDNNNNNFSDQFSRERKINKYNLDYKLSSDSDLDEKYGNYLKQKDSEQKHLEYKYYLSTTHKHDQKFEKLDNFNRKIINIKTKLDDINNGKFLPFII